MGCCMGKSQDSDNEVDNKQKGTKKRVNNNSQQKKVDNRNQRNDSRSQKRVNTNQQNGVVNHSNTNQQNGHPTNSNSGIPRKRRRKAPREYPNSGPGPADYYYEDFEHLTKPTKVAHTFGHKTYDPKRDDLPGPGSYNADSAWDKTLKRAPGYDFGGKHPGDRADHADDVPGPGTYNPNYGHSKKSFRVRGREGDVWVRKHDTPGPGYYTPDLDKEAYHGPVYTIRGKRTDRLYNDNPGPGHYDPDPMIGKTVVSQKPSAPQFSFGLKDTDADVNQKRRKRARKEEPVATQAPENKKDKKKK